MVRPWERRPSPSGIADIKAPHFIALRKDGFEPFEQMISATSGWSKAKPSQGKTALQVLKINAKLKAIAGAEGRPATEPGPVGGQRGTTSAGRAAAPKPRGSRQGRARGPDSPLPPAEERRRRPTTSLSPMDRRPTARADHRHLTSSETPAHERATKIARSSSRWWRWWRWRSAAPGSGGCRRAARSSVTTAPAPSPRSAAETAAATAGKRSRGPVGCPPPAPAAPPLASSPPAGAAALRRAAQDRRSHAHRPRRHRPHHRAHGSLGDQRRGEPVWHVSGAAAQHARDAARGRRAGPRPHRRVRQRQFSPRGARQELRQGHGGRPRRVKAPGRHRPEDPQGPRPRLHGRRRPAPAVRR